MSMNRLANLAKQHRVTALKVSNKFPLDSNATKKNQSTTKITMGELILNNKGPQRKRDAFKQDVAKPNCIRSGAKSQLSLVDEDDDDDEDDEISQDVNEADMEQDDDVDQNDDYMDHMPFANIENEIQEDDSDDDLQNEDDELIQEQLEGPNQQ